MTLPLTPEMLEAAYNFLKTTPPFRGWKLPDSDTIKFRVVSSINCSGFHVHEAVSNDHEVAISTALVGHTSTLMAVMAHEMAHVHQAHRKTTTANTQHNAGFKRLMAKICRYHGFDPKFFT